MIGSALAGLLLSTSLAGCGGNAAGAADGPREPVVVVQEVRETPPAELLRCPAPVRGLPEQGEAVIPPEWRAGIIRLARALGERGDQLGRLIQWHTGESCAGRGPDASSEAGAARQGGPGPAG